MNNNPLEAIHAARAARMKARREGTMPTKEVAPMHPELRELHKELRADFARITAISGIRSNF